MDERRLFDALIFMEKGDFKKVISFEQFPINDVIEPK